MSEAALVNLALRLKQGVPHEVLRQALTDNPIFTEESIRYAIDAIACEMLSKLPGYAQTIRGKKIAIIMAGNIPLVGISDLICVVLLNGTPLVKPSSKDKALMNWVIDILKEDGVEIEPLYANSLPDAVIATGSDASNVIFREKYGHLPLLVRGSRTSVGVLSKTPTSEESRKLWIDAFQHASLGCRNITHLVIKRGVELTPIFNEWRAIPFNNQHISNNYRQKKAILALTGKPFLDGSYFLMRESPAFGASIGEITYSYYDEESELTAFLSENKNAIQCIVGEGHIPFGQAQRPTLTDWADGIDTIDFLMRTVDRTR